MGAGQPHDMAAGEPFEVGAGQPLEVGAGPALAGRLARAEARYQRLTPAEAHAELVGGALLVDCRPQEQRQRDGEVAGAVIVGRNVLEWRFDPSGEWRVPEADDVARRVVLLCDEGCSTVLGVASLLDLGWTDVTDVIGGFQAWRAAGLPVVAAGRCLDRTAPVRRDAAGES